ncbi:MAG: hypothetical protein HRU33_08445 [Rhodobacteraceae bacterium]|nr:hypothetical protein [Paracoccaceae bacterium]
MKKTQPQYEPIKLYSDEFEELRMAVANVLRNHLASCEKFDADSESYRFMGAFDSLMVDFWTGEQAGVALDDLRRAIAQLQIAYNSIPNLVRREVEMDAEYHDHQIRQREADSLVSQKNDEQIAPGGLEAVAKSLGPLAKHADTLSRIVTKTRRELPQGIPTRNRPLKEWALIHATVDVVRAFDAMNVPSTMNMAGPLYKLLRDIFQVFGIEKNSFRRVYEGWRENVDGKYEEADLMPI